MKDIGWLLIAIALSGFIAFGISTVYATERVTVVTIDALGHEVSYFNCSVVSRDLSGINIRLADGTDLSWHGSYLIKGNQ